MGQLNSTISTDKMNPLSPSALIATLMCAFAVTEGASTAQTKNVHRYWKSPKDHFYTTDITGIGVTNIGMTGKWGYKYESVPFKCFDQSSAWHHCFEDLL